MAYRPSNPWLSLSPKQRLGMSLALQSALEDRDASLLSRAQFEQLTHDAFLNALSREAAAAIAEKLSSPTAMGAEVSRIAMSRRLLAPSDSPDAIAYPETLG